MAAVTLDVSFAGDSNLSVSPRALFSMGLALGGDSSLALTPTLAFTSNLNFQGGSNFSATPNLAVTNSVSFQGDSNFSANLVVDLGYPAPMRHSPPCRTVPASKLISDQVDLFLVDGKTRAQGIVIADLQVRVFANDYTMNWPLVSGVNIPEVRMSAGKIYWTEFSTGFYNIRFFPNTLGNWRVIITCPSLNQAVSLSYSVEQPVTPYPGTGMRTSFFRRN